MTSLDDEDLYLTTHNTHKRQTPMPSAGFEPAIPASVRPQTHALDRAATWIGKKVKVFMRIKMPNYVAIHRRLAEAV